ncbi:MULTISPECIES: sugar kinase [Enterobacterales]|uniref:sugar kinase n=1 Tax=Enterobacterales TaxID=91347 RepID=UPI000847D649|nr:MULTISPECIES: sugar kinase [Enterobacterales]MCK9780631.1 sugar kinase [Proteus columbae]WOO48949.1 sugar kinase [Hafnia alvei]MCT6519314.1 sugar kinase [Proteus vulgaris]ODQ06881.1 ketodeoxygluconokinase [Shigella sp. FC130]OEI94276.1 ketodeoxygluconokinase [Shigella sp. FC1655]
MKINKTVAIIGECMIELSGQPFLPQQQRFGGDTLNTALYLSRLIPSLHPHYMTGLGTDTYSALMQKAWEDEGINCQSVITIPDKLPGLYAIEIDACGERSFHYWRNDAAARYMTTDNRFAAHLNALPDNSVIYLSGISLAILTPEGKEALLAQLTRLKQRGFTLIVDSNYRPRLWDSIPHAQEWFEKLYSISDIALVTGDDEQILWQQPALTEQDIAQRLHQWGNQNVIIKLGVNGAYWSDGKNTGYVSPKPINSVIDTTAAGDSFNAAFIAAWLQHHSLPTCCLWGNTLAGLVIQHHGAIIPHEITDSFYTLIKDNHDTVNC